MYLTGEMLNIFSYHSGGTRTDLALKYVEANSFTKAAGDRNQVANILIVMTDGKSNMPQLTLAETAKLHNMNMKVTHLLNCHRLPSSERHIT